MISLLTILLIGLSGCTGSSYDVDFNTLNQSKVINTPEQAINAVKNFSYGIGFTLEEKIQMELDFDEAYGVDYVTCEAVKNEDDTWTVTLKGNMEGFEWADSKGGYRSAKWFDVDATIYSPDSMVADVTAKPYYSDEGVRRLYER